jgi:hypothetical protein
MQVPATSLAAAHNGYPKPSLFTPHLTRMSAA